MSVSGLAQWGPKATADFTGTNDPRVVLAAIKALTDRGNDVDFARPARPDQGDGVVSVNLGRTADGWWAHDARRHGSARRARHDDRANC